MSHDNGTAGPREGANQLAAQPRVLILGFYDGPTDGVIQFGDGGPVFAFEMPDLDGQLASHAAERVYTLAPLPADSVDRLSNLLAPYSEPAWPSWYLSCQFPSWVEERAVDAALGDLLAEADPPEWEITTADYTAFRSFHAQRVLVARPG